MVLGFKKTMEAPSGRKVPTNFQDKIQKGIKLHTVREDRTGRWKAGMKIHFATGVRQTNYNCFKEGVCKSVQDIMIQGYRVYIDGRKLASDELEYFANNDGFDTLEEFWDWFIPYTPFVGKIIHWTDLKY